jgi:hypothetical protein
MQIVFPLAILGSGFGYCLFELRVFGYLSQYIFHALDLNLDRKRVKASIQYLRDNLIGKGFPLRLSGVE